MNSILTLKSKSKKSNWRSHTTHSQTRPHTSQRSCTGCGACRKIARSTNASAGLMLKSLDPGKKVCATRFLQRTYGNRYVQRLIQTKMDSSCLERCGSRAIQMKASGCCGGCANHGKEEEESPVQTKLAIGRPGDRYEQEADRISEQVMRMPEVERQRQPEEEEEEIQMQAKPVAEQITPLVQRQPMEEEEEELQAKEVSDRTPDVTPDVTPDLEASLSANRGGGQPLPEADRDFMEKRFGADFSGVRVHTDSSAVQMSRRLNAEAFTHGSDIYFGAGRYSPGSASGKRLLAHELTHVVQQKKHIHPKRILRYQSTICGRPSTQFSDFPKTYIKQVDIDLSSQSVRLIWEGPKKSMGKTGPFPASTGAGKCCLDCNDYKTSRQNGSFCTPKGIFTVKRYRCTMPGVYFLTPGDVKYATYFHIKRGIALHSSPNVPSTPKSHGCIRLTENIAKIIYDNTRLKKTIVRVSGGWKGQYCYKSFNSDLSNRNIECTSSRP